MNRVDRIRNLSSRRFLRNLDTDDKNTITILIIFQYFLLYFYLIVRLKDNKKLNY